MSFNKHEELKEALRLFNETITGFANSLEKPDGSIGVSRTAVIYVAQGRHSTEWIQLAIESKIQEAKETFPGYYKNKSKTEVA
jgi:hypothetical protein